MPRLESAVVAEPIARWAMWLAHYLSKAGVTHYRLAAAINDERGYAPKTFSSSRVRQWTDGRRRVSADDAFITGQILGRFGAPINGLIALYAAGHIHDFFGLLIHTAALNTDSAKKCVIDFCNVPSVVTLLDLPRIIYVPGGWHEFYGFDPDAEPHVTFDTEYYAEGWSHWLRAGDSLPGLPMPYRRRVTEIYERLARVLRATARYGAHEPSLWADTLVLSDDRPFHDYLVWLERIEHDLYADGPKDCALEHLNDLHDLLVLSDDDLTILSDAEKLGNPFRIGMELLAFVRAIRAWDEFSATRTWRIFGEWANEVNSRVFAEHSQQLPPAFLEFGHDPLQEKGGPTFIRL